MQEKFRKNEVFLAGKKGNKPLTDEQKQQAAVIRRRWFTWLGIAAALLICYSRIYLAKHFPVDLLLGTGVGILTGLFMLWLYKKSGRGFFKPLDPSGTRQAE